jgi:hypothetical protein
LVREIAAPVQANRVHHDPAINPFSKKSTRAPEGARL